MKTTKMLMAAVAVLAFAGQAFGQAAQTEGQARATLVEIHQECLALPSLDGAVFGCLAPFAKAPVASASAVQSDLHQECLATPSLDGAAFGCLAPVGVDVGKPAERAKASSSVHARADDLGECVAQPSLDGAVFGCLDLAAAKVGRFSAQIASADVRVAGFGEGCEADCSHLAP